MIRLFCTFFLAFLIISCNDKSVDAVIEDTGWINQDLNSSHLNIVLFTDHNHGWIANVFDTIHRTTDGGLTWTDHYIPYKRKYSVIKSIFFFDNNEGWCTGDFSNLLHTIDGGITWEVVKYKPDSIYQQKMGRIQFVNRNTGWFIANDYLLFKTIDGGVNWEKIIVLNTDDVFIKDFTFVDELRGIAIGSYGYIFKTVDGGRNWDTIDHGIHNTYFSDICFVDENTGWIECKDFIIKTTDCGESWNIQNLMPHDGIEKIFFCDKMNGWMIHARPPLMLGPEKYYTMQKTTDGGETWHYLARSTHLSEQGIYYKGHLSLNDIFFIDEFKGWAVGDYGRIIHTENGGNLYGNN